VFNSSEIFAVLFFLSDEEAVREKRMRGRRAYRVQRARGSVVFPTPHRVLFSSSTSQPAVVVKVFVQLFFVARPRSKTKKNHRDVAPRRRVATAGRSSRTPPARVIDEDDDPRGSACRSGQGDSI